MREVQGVTSREWGGDARQRKGASKGASSGREQLELNALEGDVRPSSVGHCQLWEGVHVLRGGGGAEQPSMAPNKPSDWMQSPPKAWPEAFTVQLLSRFL